MKKTSIGYVLPVEGVSRKFCPVSEKCNVQTGKKWIGAMIKKTANKEFSARSTNYLTVRVHPITVPPTTNQLWAHTRFAEIQAAVVARRKDLSQINTDKANFLAQKNEPGGVKSMFAYLWKLETVIYDQAHPRA